jgi:hypothetical protein
MHTFPLIAIAVAGFVAALTTPTEKQATLEYVTRFPFKKPAFVTANVDPRDPKRIDLMISSFGVSLLGPNPDRVTVISDIAQAIKTQNYTATQVGGAITWPNEVKVIQDDLVAAGGFLVPGKRGHISTLNYADFVAGKSVEWKPLVSPSDGFFHRVEKVRYFLALRSLNV